MGFLLTNGILDDQPGLSPVKHQFRVLEQLGIPYHEGVRIEFWPRKDDFEYAKELLHGEWIDETTHDVVGINIAASERWATKNWPIPSLAKLCDMLAADGVRVVITGMEKDQAFVRELLTQAKSKPTILVGKTNILQLAALVSFCKVYVTPDSAPLHVAAAMKVPVIALFGPTAPGRHLPPADEMNVLVKSFECMPCYKTECKTHKCMFAINPAEVHQIIKEYLPKKGS